MKIQTRIRVNTFISLGTLLLILLSLGWSSRAVFVANQDMELIDTMRSIVIERIFVRDEYLLYQEERATLQWYIKSEKLQQLLDLAVTRFNQKNYQDLLEEAQADFNATRSVFTSILERHSKKVPGGKGALAFSEAELRLINQEFLKAYSLNDNLVRLDYLIQKTITNIWLLGGLMVLSSFFLGIIAIFINSVIISRTLTKRVASLASGVEVIGSGNLDYRIAVEGNDELTALALASNAMAVKLRDTFTSVGNLEREVEQRRRSEELLRETRDYLENLITFANAPIIVWNPQLLITRCNHAFEKLTGKKEGEIIGHSLKYLFPSDEVETSLEHITSTLSGERLESVEVNICHANGSVRTVLWSSATIFAADGATPLATIAQGQDVTQRKQAESRLAATVEELHRSNRELEQFAYVASHDLQEPLRMVTSYTQLLAERYENQLDAKAQKFIHYAVDGAVRMQRLIKDLLEFSRVSSRGAPFAAVDCNQLLAQVLDSLQATIRATGAVITSDPLPVVMGDQVQIAQLFQNLLTNAIKFCVNIPPTIHVGSGATDSHWQLSVRDNGIGIDKQYADKIFVIFQRLHSREEYEGTGIGLAVCKRIVERHSGALWFESEGGQGTTFYCTFPRRDGEDLDEKHELTTMTGEAG